MGGMRLRYTFGVQFDRIRMGDYHAIGAMPHPAGVETSMFSTNCRFLALPKGSSAVPFGQGVFMPQETIHATIQQPRQTCFAFRFVRKSKSHVRSAPPSALRLERRRLLTASTADHAPVAAGGVPPSGLDMNGILFGKLSAVVRWANAGGGYPRRGLCDRYQRQRLSQRAPVLRADGSGYWFNTVDGNNHGPTTQQHAAGWLRTLPNGAAVIRMASANVALAPVQYGKPIIVITGALTSNLNLVFPNIDGQWSIVNATTGGSMINLKTASNPGISIVSGFLAISFVRPIKLT